MKNSTIFHMIQSSVVGGGMENIFLEYSKILQKNNFNLICLVPQNFCHVKELTKNNIKVEPLNITGHFNIFSAIKLHFLIKKYSPKLILAHNGRTFAIINICKRLFGINDAKTIAVSHGGSVKRMANFDFIITVAKHLQSKISKSGFKGSATNIYNGYQISEFYKNKLSNVFTFGVLSRLSKEKGIDSAIRAFKKFNDQVNQNSYLIIGGEGNELENLKSITSTLKLTEKVKFIGWVKNKESFFNQIDVCLQPCLKDSFGITTIESFNYQTPVIASDSDGPKEIIQDGYSGYLFDPNSPDALFLTMKKAYLEREKHPQIIANASKNLKEKFSYEIMEEELVRLINTITV